VADTVRASHILLMYQGSMRSSATRSKDDALSQLQAIKAEIDGGAEFGALAREHSDCPSGQEGGDLGTFGPGQMVPAFEETTYALAVGGLSDVFETPFGFHIVQRTA